MIRILLVGAFILSGGMLVARQAEGGDAPVPRAPIGPPEILSLEPYLRSNEKYDAQPRSGGTIVIPSGLAPTLIRLTNVGAAKLHIAYRDGDANWKNNDLEAQQPVELSCQQCSNFIVAFHNGKAPTQVRVSGGMAYLLGWSDILGLWILTTDQKR